MFGNVLPPLNHKHKGRSSFWGSSPLSLVAVGVLVGIYFVWLLYLILRILGEWSTDTFGHVPRRVKFLWFVARVSLEPGGGDG